MISDLDLAKKKTETLHYPSFKEQFSPAFSQQNSIG
jgi:hypothetical protein